DVTRYCLNSILSIMNSLCDGLVPIYEDKVSYINNSPSHVPFEKYMVAKLYKTTKADDLFFPIGISYINGVESATDGIYKRNIVFENAINRYSFKLGAARDTKASYTEFKGRFIDLSWSGFVPYKKQGISLDALNNGTYRVLIDVRYNGKIYKGGLRVSEGFKDRIFCKDKVINFFCYEGDLYCTVKLISSGVEFEDIFLSVENHWVENDLFHIEGIFHIQGVSYENYKDVDYFLSVESQNKKETFRLGMSFRPRVVAKKVNSVLPSDKAYYSTLMRKGIDVSKFKGETCKVVIHQYTPDRNVSAEIGYVVM
uniref:hypothetical protein n=1 Tax=Aeromonas sp. HMWF014 TaxID=2056850 RepID=UPI001C635947